MSRSLVTGARAVARAFAAPLGGLRESIDRQGARG
jgi:hypothetical protein